MMHSKKEHKKREELLAEEHPFGDVGQIILFIVFMIVWLLDSFVLKITVNLAGVVPIIVRLVFMAIFIVFGICLMKSLHKVLDEVNGTTTVIQKGVFKYVRHPLYLGCILFYLGLVLATFSIAAFTVFILICISYNFIASYEEKKLVDKFGNDYLEYKKNVPKWFPKIWEHNMK